MSLPPMSPESPLKQVVKFFGSMQFGLVLLLVLAAVSAGATLLEMTTAFEQVYSSWWYITMITFLALNILLCCVRRIGPLYRLALHPQHSLSAEEIARLPDKRIADVTSVADPIAAAAEAFKGMGMRVTAADGPSGKVVCGERGVLGYFGSLISHISLLVIMFGAVYGAATGYDISNGGWVGSTFSVDEANLTVDISDIRMVQAEDPRIRPRVYSDVTVFREGELLTAGTVSINYPLRFDGNTIYHSTFLNFPVFRLIDLETGEMSSSRFLTGDRIYLDANRTTYIAVGEFYPNFSMHPDGRVFSIDYRPVRPVTVGAVVRNNQSQDPVFLPLNQAQVFETPTGRVEVMKTGIDLAVVYSISRNLGRPFLFAGSLLLLAGLSLSFFVSPVRCYAVLLPDGSLQLGGSRYRSKLSLAATLASVEERIQSRREAK